MGYHGIILPIDFHIFQDAYCTTNQTAMDTSQAFDTSKHVEISWLQCHLHHAHGVTPRPSCRTRSKDLRMSQLPALLVWCAQGFGFGVLYDKNGQHQHWHIIVYIICYTYAHVHSLFESKLNLGVSPISQRHAPGTTRNCQFGPFQSVEAESKNGYHT